MKRLTIAAAAASALLLGAAAFAQVPSTSAPSTPGSDGSPRTEQRSERMERRAARMDERMSRRIEKLRTELKLTPAQEPLWAPVQAQLRKMQDERRSFRNANAGRVRNAELPDRLDMMSDRMTRGAASMRELSASVKPLWATLDAPQKEAVRKNMPGRGRGDGGHEGRGERRN